MSKGKHHEPVAPEDATPTPPEPVSTMPVPQPPAGSLESQIRAKALECGLGEPEVQAAMRGDFSGKSIAGASGSPGTQRIVDGVLLGRFFDFVKSLLPILLPILLPGSTAGVQETPKFSASGHTG